MSEADLSLIYEYFDHYGNKESQKPTADRTKPLTYSKYLGMKKAGLSIYDFHTCNNIPIESGSWAMFAVATTKDRKDFEKMQTIGYNESDKVHTTRTVERSHGHRFLSSKTR